VRNTLIGMGVPADFLQAKGYGDSKPIASNDTPEGRFQNRRISYTVVQ
jgi:OmpA-OmpF porin, OOP family